MLPSNIKLQNSVDAARRSDAWLGLKSIIPITKENVLHGTGAVELLPRDILKQRDGEPMPNGPIMKVGKYAGKELAWIRANDASYFDWAVTNIGYLKRYQNSV